MRKEGSPENKSESTDKRKTSYPEQATRELVLSGETEVPGLSFSLRLNMAPSPPVWCLSCNRA